MTLDPATIARLRADAPACEDMLFVNSAGASLTPEPVHRAMLDHLRLECAVSPYEAEAKAHEALDAMYTNLAELLGARPDEIAWADSATRAWDMAFYSIPLEPGDNIVTHSSEYGSNFLAFLQKARRRGVELRFAPSGSDGLIDPDGLHQVIDGRTRLVSATHVPTQGGYVNPVCEIGAVAQEHGIPYLVDACNSVGQLAVDVEKMGCSFLSAAGRKFLRGPRGSGFLYINKELIPQVEPPFIDLHAARWTGPSSYEWAAASTRFEAWESSIVGRVGLAAAVRYALEIGIEAIEAHVIALATRLRRGLEALDPVTVHEIGEPSDGILSFTSTTHPARAIVQHLRDNRIIAATITKDDALLDFEARGLSKVVRVSFHAFNTEAEVDRVLEVMKKLVSG